MIILIIIIVIVLFFVIHYTAKKNSLYKRLHPHFCDKISYMDFIKLTKERNPIFYFELRQLYDLHDNKVNESDYNQIIEKYS
jgi:hypothetical protein